MNRRSCDQFWEACGAPGRLRFELDGDGQAGAHGFERPFTVVGRAPENDLRLNHPSVRRRQAYLQVIAGRLFCLDLGGRLRVTWDDEARRSGWVDRDRGIGLGPYRLRPSGEPGPPGRAIESPLLTRSLGETPLLPLALEFPRKDGQPLWRVSRVLTLIGGAPECRMRLLDPAVSRFHCSLLRTDAGAWVIDLHGRGGIAVNGERVPAARLEEGDLLQVGPFLMRIRTEPPEPDARWLVPGSSRSWVDWSPVAAVAAVGPTPPRELPLPAGGPMPEVVRPVDPLLARMTSQFDEMQRQMFDQFQQALAMMAEMVGKAQRDQSAQVRQEIDLIEQRLRAFPLEAFPSPRLPGGVSAAGEPIPADALLRIVSMIQAAQQRSPAPIPASPGVQEPEAEPATNGKAAKAAEVALPAGSSHEHQTPLPHAFQSR
jgi:pSer/pThr/pTyr-binding forkhead associated (FHA) protein